MRGGREEEGGGLFTRQQRALHCVMSYGCRVLSRVVRCCLVTVSTAVAARGGVCGAMCGGVWQCVWRCVWWRPCAEMLTCECVKGLYIYGNGEAKRSR